MEIVGGKGVTGKGLPTLQHQIGRAPLGTTEPIVVYTKNTKSPGALRGPSIVGWCIVYHVALYTDSFLFHFICLLNCKLCPS